MCHELIKIISNVTHAMTCLFHTYMFIFKYKLHKHKSLNTINVRNRLKSWIVFLLVLSFWFWSINSLTEMPTSANDITTWSVSSSARASNKPHSFSRLTETGARVSREEWQKIVSIVCHSDTMFCHSDTIFCHSWGWRFLIRLLSIPEYHRIRH